MHLAEKLKAISAGAADLTAKIEAKADALLAKRAELEHRATAALSAHEDVLADAEAGVADIEAALKHLTN